MTIHKRASPVLLARQLRSYAPGERVRVLLGKHAGKILTVREATNDWVRLREAGSRELMSRVNLEPENGFTEDELARARRVSEKIG